MKTKFCTKVLTVFVALLVLITALPLSAYAVDLSSWSNTIATYGDEYRGANGYFAYGTYSYITYEDNGTLKVHTHTVDGTLNRRKLGIKNNTTQEWIQVMCIESGTSYTWGKENTSVAGESSAYWNKLPNSVKELIMLAAIKGWSPGKTCPGQASINAGANEDDFSFATQIIIWEIQQQIRTGTGLNDRHNKVVNGVTLSANLYYNLLSGHPATLECYKWILSQMANHSVIPSFASKSSAGAQTVTLEYNKTSKTYQATLTDTNNTLADLTRLNSGAVTVIRNNNKYYFSSTTPINGIVTAKYSKYLASKPDTFLVWNTPGYQTAITGAYDPINFYLKFVTNSTADLRIKKIDASGDNNISGIMFNITGNGETQTVSTNLNGVVDVELEPGTYTITEQSLSGYIKQDPQTITLEPGDSKSVTFTNHKYVTFQIKKVDGSGLNNIKDIEFSVYNEDGDLVFNKKTNASGIISEKLPAGKYFIIETPVTGYERQKTKAVVLSETNPQDSITITNEASPIELKIIKKDSSGLNKISGITFNIQGNGINKNYVTDSEGLITVKLKPGTYTVSEVTPNGFKDLASKTVTLSLGDESKSVTFTNVPQTGNAHVKKTSEDGFVEGFTFLLEGTSVIGKAVNITAVTDANGIADFGSVLIGTYTISEINTPDKYEIPASVRVTIKNGDNKEVKFHNTLVKHGLKIYKTSEDNNISGIEFVISGTDSIGNAVNITRRTDDSGLIAEELQPGNYTVTEVVPEGYNTQQSVNVTLTNNDAVVRFHNTVKPTPVKIKKVDLSGYNNISGIYIIVYGVEQNFLFTGFTDENGEINLSLKPGVYTVAEIAPAGYKTQPSQELTVQFNDTAKEITFYNEVNPVELEIVKEDLSGFDNISDIEFTITGDGVNKTVKTNAAGMISASLNPGTYTITETVPYGYKSVESQTVTLNIGDQKKTVTFENDVKPVELRIVKVDTSGNNVISGLKFIITGSENYYKECFTDNNGIIAENLKPGTYTIHEVPVEGWDELSDVTVVLSIGDTQKSVTFENKESQGNVNIIKTSDDGVISNVSFRIYGASNVGTPVDITVTTDINGSVISPSIPLGTYTVEELNVPERYFEQVAKRVVITKNTTSTISFDNKIKPAVAAIEKTSEDGKISGILFNVTGINVKGEQVSFDLTTDAQGKASKEIVPGVYTVTENVPEGYKAQDSITLNIEPDTTGTFSFYNEQLRGNVRVTKTSEDGVISGHKFRLYGTSTTGDAISVIKETDNEGIAVFDDIPVGTYMLEEVDALDKYITPLSQSVDVIQDETVTMSFVNVLKKGNLHIYKSSEDGSIEGVKFRLSGITDTGIVIDIEKTTNSEGFVEFTNLQIGQYTVEEVDAANYYLVPSPETTLIEWNATCTVRFSNELKRGNISVKKNSEDGVVAGIEFRLYGTADCGQQVDLISITNGEGIALFEDVLVGSYILEEINSPDKYIASASQDVSIVYNETTYKTFENILKRGNISLTKVDSEYPDMKLSGAEFDVYNEIGEKVGVMSESEPGYYVMSDLPYGNYKVVESKVPVGYISENKEFHVSILENGETYNISDARYSYVANTPIKGNVRITKVDEEYPDNKLAGAKFEIYDANGLFVCSIPEVQEGVYEYNGLRYGSYTIRETESPEGFVLNDKTYSFSITENGYTYDIKDNDFEGLTNKPIKGSVTITKIDKDYPDHKLTGAEFTVYNEDHVEIGKMTETEPGIYVATGLRYGKYYIHETAAPTGFILKDTEYEVFVSENEYVYEIKDSGFEGIYNAPIKGGICLYKIDKDYPDAKLSGAIFEVYDSDMNSIGFLTETKEGYYEISGLRYGKYFVKEIESPDNYVCKDTVYEIDILENEQIYEIKDAEFGGIYNEYKKGELRVAKTSADGKIEGFSFRITGTDYDRVFTTDENGIIEVEGLRIGEYIVSEIDNESSKGYILPDSKSVTVLYNDTVDVSMYNEIPQTPPPNPPTNDSSVVLASVLMISTACAAFVFSKRTKF